MKRLLSIALIFTLCITTMIGNLVFAEESIITGEKLLYETGFEKITTDGGSIVSPSVDGWTLGSEFNPKAGIDNSTATAGSKFGKNESSWGAKLYSTAPKKDYSSCERPSLKRFFVTSPITSGVVSYQFDFKIVGNRSANAILGHSNIGSFNLYKDKITMDGRDGQSTIVTGLKNDWHTLKVFTQINTEKNEESKNYVYLNDKYIGTYLTRFPTTPARTINEIKFVGGYADKPAGGEVEAYFDNVKVTYSEDNKVVISKSDLKAASPGLPEGKMPEYKKIVDKMKSEAVGVVSLLIDRPIAMLDDGYIQIDKNDNLVVPFIKNGRTLVPVRFISEAFGAKVAFDEASKMISISNEQNIVKMVLNSDTISINGVDKTIDVAPQIYNDRTFIPLRAMVEAIGKKVFWDDRGLIMISDKSEPLSEPYMVDIMINQLNSPPEPKGIASYSTTFMSARWYRGDFSSKIVDMPSSNAIKRFGGVQNIWSYMNQKNHIEGVINLGLPFQASFNTIIGTKGADGHIPGGAKTFEGKPIIAPWMTFGAPWACQISTKYNEVVRELGKKYIDYGASEFHFDDADGNMSVFNFSTGCFCDDCVNGFKEYLKQNISQEELLSKYNIPDINSFNYKSYLTEKHNIATDGDYIAKRGSIPLHTLYYKYQAKGTADFYINLKKDLSEYLGKDVLFSGNVGALNLDRIEAESQNVLFSAMDFGSSEANITKLKNETLVPAARIFSSIGKPIIATPVHYSRVPQEMRPTIALTYALGHYMLIPWDVYIGTADRFCGSIYDYGDMYLFMREYPYLFNGYEIPAKIGVLANWDEDINAKNSLQYKNFAMQLFNAGVPYKAIMVAYSADRPNHSIDAQQLKGLDYLITYSSLDKIKAEDREKIEKSGVNVISKESVNEQWINSQKKAVVTNTNGNSLYAIPRTKGENTSVHIINKDEYEVARNVTLTIDADFAKGEEAYIFKPGCSPVKANVVIEGNKKRVIVDEMNEWAIISFASSTNDIRKFWDIPMEYTGYVLGNPTTWGSASTSEGAITLTSSGMGVNVTAVGDTGTQDSGTFVYKHLMSPVIKDFEISAKVSDITDGQAGIMVREFASSNSPFIGVRNIKGKGLVMDVRKDFDIEVISTELEINKPYIKIAKKGLAYEVYGSDDGNNWGSPLATSDVVLKTAIAGIFSASGDVSKKASAVFSDIVINEKGVTLKKSDITKLNVKANAILKDGIINILNGESANLILNSEIKGKEIELSWADVQALSSNPDIITIVGNGKVNANNIGDSVIKISLVLSDGVFEKNVDIKSSSEIVVVDENFESYPIGTPLQETSSMWIRSIAPITERDDGKGKCYFVDTANTGVGYNQLMQLPIKLERDFIVELEQKVEIKPGVTNSGAMVLYVTGVGQIISTLVSSNDYWYYANSKSTSVAKYDGAKWKKHKIHVKFSTKTFDWYIDDELVAKDAPFRGNDLAAEKLTLGLLTNPVDTKMWLDSIKVILKK